jgi:hypothetical protein
MSSEELLSCIESLTSNTKDKRQPMKTQHRCGLLIVTIAAGGLGTVVGFSRRFYGRAGGDPSMARLFVNVGEGIAAAIAIFLFSGAGMLALTQGGGSTNEVELSPYTVAFIAFVSGFMAEDAFGRIQSAGKKIFQSDDAAKDDPEK